VTPSRRGTSVAVSPRSPDARATLKRERWRKEELTALTLEISAWLASTLNAQDYQEGLLESEAFQNGQLLCDLLSRLKSLKARNFKLHKNAKPSSFAARDNVKTFVDAALDYGVPPEFRIEPEDLVSGRNPRGVLIFLLELARQAWTKDEMPPPGLIELEAAIAAARKRHRESTADRGGRSRLLEPSIDSANEVDSWVAQFCREYKVPRNALPMRLEFSPGTAISPSEGVKVLEFDIPRYVFLCDAEPRPVHYVRVVRGIAMCCTDTSGWESFAAVIERKAQVPLASAFSLSMETEISSPAPPKLTATAGAAASSSKSTSRIGNAQSALIPLAFLFSFFAVSTGPWVFK